MQVEQKDPPPSQQHLNTNSSTSGGTVLCASCDRCRSRKTKCDGQRPCSNCAVKYMKKHKVDSIKGVPLEEIECVYSPAKRRGPIPGKAGFDRRSKQEQLKRSAAEVAAQTAQQQQQHNNSVWATTTTTTDHTAAAAAAAAGVLDPQAAAVLLGAGGAAGSAAVTSIWEQQQQQQQQRLQQPSSQLEDTTSGGAEEPLATRMKRDSTDNGGGGASSSSAPIPRTITTHTHLLERNDQDGARLFAYYILSIDEMFRLPSTPSDDEYCARLNSGLTPRMLPGPQLAALSAARFSEIALGALVHNEVSLAMELCNAVVHCLRESVQDHVATSVMFEVAKAYFLLGVFRACRGDMVRYFKYRRVCMTYLAKLKDDSNTAILMAAISFLDSWAYMVYNADEQALPSVDETIPPVAVTSSAQQQSGYASSTSSDTKYNVKVDPCSIACDPKNQNWIQGAPPVFLNNEAPLHARSLDAIACAVRTCCDQANSRFAAIAKEAEPGSECSIRQETIITPTTTAVLANENELCSRNMILSAYTLMQQHDSSHGGKDKNVGQHMVISAMDAFLENSDEEGEAGFTDSQIQSLLSVCNTALENPCLLHHAGPTYHMVTNAAVLLCHLLNGMYAMRSNGGFGSMENTMFEEVLDTYIPIRKLLTIHRRKLPVKLRCHGLPRPSFDTPKEGEPFIDLGETLLCPCRGCQGFVLMACSPCVAAERARAAKSRMEVEMMQEAEAVEIGEIDKELDSLAAEFDLDDDVLLGMISNLIST